MPEVCPSTVFPLKSAIFAAISGSPSALTQPHHAGMRKEGRHVCRGELPGAVGVQGCCGHPGWQTDENVYAGAVALLQKDFEPLPARDVDHLVRVGYDRRCAEGQDCVSERLGEHHAGLDVHVRVGIPRRDNEPRAVQHLRAV